jgi:hypothetical protein
MDSLGRSFSSLTWLVHDRHTRVVQTIARGEICRALLCGHLQKSRLDPLDFFFQRADGPRGEVRLTLIRVPAENKLWFGYCSRSPSGECLSSEWVDNNRNRNKKLRFRSLSSLNEARNGIWDLFANKTIAAYLVN